MKRECDHLLSYVANTLDATEQKKFKEHLNHCDECVKEYEQIMETWDELQFDFEEQEVPGSLKNEVLEFVFEQNRKGKDDTIINKLKEWTYTIKRQFTPLSTSLILVMLAMAFILTFQSNSLQTDGISNPIEIKSSMGLTSANQSISNANGNAYIVQQGDEDKLVIQVNDLPRLEGSNVYQVWLLKDGERQNAGIFKTDELGSGVLTYHLPDGHSFDKIGITMEPDQHSTEPKGEKIIGS